MAQAPGLFTRNGTFYLRYIVPQHHLQAFGGQTRVVRSLHTHSRKEAITKAVLLRAQLISLSVPSIEHRPNAATTKQIPLSHTPQALSLHALLREWQNTKQPSQDTYRACELAVQAFVQLEKKPNITINEINRQSGQRFASHLMHHCNSAKTAHGKLTWVKSLLNFAVESLEVLARNPWTGIDIKYSKTSKRRTWSDSEISKLLEASKTSAVLNPTSKRAGGAAAYWLPLLAMFTGARLSELAQLHASDITEQPDGYWLRITNSKEDQRLKSVHANRAIPIHETLVQAGFIDYVKNNALNAALWPELPRRKDKAGGYFSNWFGQHLKQLGLQGLDFHSFRHTFRTRLVMSNTPEAVIDTLMGHSTNASIGKSRYTHVQPILRQYLTQLEYRTSEFN